MDLSIIIVNWNSAVFLRKCLESLYANACRLDFELFVVDNASFDGCDEIVKNEFPRARFIQNEENIGFAEANNLGFAHSIGRNILFLNPDTEVVGAALQVMCSFLDSTSNAGIAGPKLLNRDLTVQTSCIQRFPSVLNQALDAQCLRRLFSNSRLWGIQPLFTDDDAPIAVEVISGACMMVKRSVLEKVGLFNTDYFMYTEDVELCYKVKEVGLKAYYVSDASVIHHGGGSTGSKPLAAIMMRESIFRFLREVRGPSYAMAYRLTQALAAVCRLLLLGTVFLLTAGRGRTNSLTPAAAKWTRILRWALGLEELATTAAGNTRSLPKPTDARENNWTFLRKLP